MKIKLISLFVLLFSVPGCDKLKGKDGLNGVDGKSVKADKVIYGGTPIGNPYSFEIKELADFDKIVVEVYAVYNDTTGSYCFKLPINDGNASHMYMIDTKNRIISLKTIFTNGTQPTHALTGFNGGRMTYEIIIYRFDNALSKSLPQSLLKNNP